MTYSGCSLVGVDLYNNLKLNKIELFGRRETNQTLYAYYFYSDVNNNKNWGT